MEDHELLTQLQNDINDLKSKMKLVDNDME